MTFFDHPSVDELAALIHSTVWEIERSAESRRHGAEVSPVVSPKGFSTGAEMAQESQVFVSPESNPMGERLREKPFARPLGDALAGSAEELRWVWSGFLAHQAVTLVAGVPKVGKTTTLFGLIAAMVDGSDFAGRATVATGVLLLSEERPPSLREKMERFGLDERVHLTMRHETSGMSWSEIVAEAVAYAKQHDLGVIVVDTIDKWWGLRGDQENSSGAVLEAFQPLAAAAAEGLAVLISTHQRKSGGEHGEAVRGSNALTGAVDVIVELERGKGDLDTQASRVLKATSRFEATPEKLVLRLEDDRFVGDDPEAAEEKAQRSRVLDVLSDDLLESAAVAEASGVSKANSSRRLSELHAEGLVEREGAGRKGDPYRYRLSDTGTLPDIGDGAESPTNPEDGSSAENAYEPRTNATTAITATTPDTPIGATVKTGASLTSGATAIETAPPTTPPERVWCLVCGETKRTLIKPAYPGLVWLVCGHRSSRSSAGTRQ
jgi:hypothetical protein